MSDKIDRKYLAILFFNSDYNSLSPLPGVKKDKTELMKLLYKYEHVLPNGNPVINSSDVLQDLKDIIEKRKNEEYERVHFHFSGKEL